MPDFSLIPADHQPDFEDVSLVPIDHDPFGAGGTIQRAQVQPENPPQPLVTGADQPDGSATADRSGTPPTDRNLRSAQDDSYPTADAAAVAALQDINPTSQRFGLEYAGRVYHKWFGLGNYSYTPPSEGTAYSSSPGNSVLTPLLHSFGVNAGTYHTHARGADRALNEDYSPKDKRDSDYEGVPSYLGAPSGSIYKYSPIPNQPSQGRISVLGNTNGSPDKK